MNKQILIVDDEPIVRESIKDWLEDAGYRVATVGSGEEAEKMLENIDFGLVIMDIRLPGKTGISVLKDIRSIKPDIQSIIITAYPTNEFMGEAKKLGAVDFLVKPINPTDLEKLIHDIFAKNVGQ